MKFSPPIPSCSNENSCFHAGDYSFGFNGKDKESEFNSGAYDFGARIHDARLGRFFRIDAATRNISSLSPFQYAGNSPVIFIDSNGNILRFPDVQEGQISDEQLLFISIYENSTEEYKAELDKLVSSEVIYDISFVSKEVINGNGGLTSLSEELDDCGEEQLVVKIQINSDINESKKVWAYGDELQSAVNLENNSTGFAVMAGSNSFSALSNDLKDEWLSQLAGCEAFNQLAEKYPDKIKENDLEIEQQALDDMYDTETSANKKKSLFDNNGKQLIWFSTGRAKEYLRSIGGKISDNIPADYGLSDKAWPGAMEKNGISRVVFKRSSDESLTDIKR